MFFVKAKRLHRTKSRREAAYLDPFVLENLDGALKKAEGQKHSMSDKMACSMLLAIAITKMKRGDEPGLQAVTYELLDTYSELLPDYIELLHLNQEYRSNPSAFEDEERLNYFCHLTEKAHFMPSVWLLTRLALKPDSPISPGVMIDTLTSLESTHKVNSLILTAFALVPDDANLAVEYEQPDNKTVPHQALWIFSSLFHNHRKDYWPGPENGFSPKLQHWLCMTLKQTVTEIRQMSFSRAISEAREFLPTRTEAEKARFGRQKS
ncbi:hypothetical protein [Endozoicomonas montiporae]|uniref:hypothetical protein n=1 Tax=Endozoicomonas montiporae TaxID=1027273 RepID=UPI000B2BA6A0|nr:hypothetical protein [Endozoicomonas montiporae]